MNSSIKIYNSYLKGTKTILGSFPIYFSNYELVDGVDRDEIKKFQYDELLNEVGQYFLLDQSSDDINVNPILIPFTVDYFLSISI